MRKDDKDDLLITDDAARLLGITSGDLSVKRQRGTGPRYLKLGNGAVRYRRADLLAYLAKTARVIEPKRVSA
jgi:predicted DNA-binding transcriptional regulator AlpA